MKINKRFPLDKSDIASIMRVDMQGVASNVN